MDYSKYYRCPVCITVHSPYICISIFQKIRTVELDGKRIKLQMVSYFNILTYSGQLEDQCHIFITIAY